MFISIEFSPNGQKEFIRIPLYYRMRATRNVRILSSPLAVNSGGLVGFATSIAWVFSVAVRLVAVWWRL